MQPFWSCLLLWYTPNKLRIGKIFKTLCQGQWPRGTKENEQIKLMFLLEKSVTSFTPAKPGFGDFFQTLILFPGRDKSNNFLVKEMRNTIICYGYVILWQIAHVKLIFWKKRILWIASNNPSKEISCDKLLDCPEKEVIRRKLVDIDCTQPFWFFIISLWVQLFIHEWKPF